MRSTRSHWLSLGAAVLLATSAAAQTCPQVLAAPDTQANDRRGDSVAVEGDVLLAAASFATGAEPYTGMVIAYRRDAVSGGWVEEQRLTASDGQTGDLLGRSIFGTSLALDGDTFVVGAHGVDGAEIDSGAVYEFRRDPASGHWVEHAKIEVAGWPGYSYFGTQLALDGDWLFVAAYLDPYPQMGLNSPGRVHVFRRDAQTGEWVEHQTLHSQLATTQLFGHGLAIDGEFAAIGSATGHAWLFRLSPATGMWSQWQYLVAVPYASSFGRSVDIDGDRAVVGAPGHGEGDAYVFRPDPTGYWAEEARLVSAHLTPNARAGESVRIAGTRIVVGAPESPLATATVYDYDPQALAWVEGAPLTARGASDGAAFGEDLDVDDATIVVGAAHDARVDGLGGATYAFSRALVDCNGNGMPDACEIAQGLAADVDENGVIDDCEPLGEVYCTPGFRSSSGRTAALWAFGVPIVAAGTLRTRADGLPPGQAGFLLCSRDGAQATLPGTQGFFCLGGAIGRFGLQSSGGLGAIETVVDLGALPLDPPVAVQPGDTWNFQLWYRDASPGPASNLTPAVRVEFQ